MVVDSLEIDSRASLAIDSLDDLHVSFARKVGSDFNLYYSKRTTGWSAYEVVEGTASEQIGQLSSLALDDANEVKISYMRDDASNQFVRHAYGSAGSFNTEAVDTIAAGETIKDISIAMDNDATNTVHMIYSSSSSSSFGLTYRTNDTTWALGTNETPGSLPSGTCSEYGPVSIAVDSSGDPHIAYTCETSGGACYVYYAKKTGASWGTHAQIATVTPVGCSIDSMDAHDRPSIALDSNNKAHVIHVDAGNALEYMTNAGGSWAAEVSIDTSLDQKGHSIAVDQDDNPIIIYSKSGALKYSSKNSGSWSTPASVGQNNVHGVGQVVVEGVAGRSNR